MSKIAVLIPGIGYTCDRPLLYFAGKLAQNNGYQIIRLSFKHLGGKKKLIGNEKKMKKVFEHALEQTKEQLDIDELAKADEVLFISKSVGTAVAAAYDAGHRSRFTSAGTIVRHIYFTPVAGTFAFMRPESGIAFHGTSDPWVEHQLVVNACMEKNVPLYITENANHSLETGDVMADLETLQKTMQITASFICQDDGQKDTAAASENESLSIKRPKADDAPAETRRIIRIEEDDYGCEELPEGQEPQVRVILEDADGSQTALKAADRILRERGIDEGDLVTVDADGTLHKADEK